MKKYYYLWYDHTDRRMHIEFISAKNIFEAEKIAILRIKMHTNDLVAYSSHGINVTEIKDSDFVTMDYTIDQAKKLVRGGYCEPELLSDCEV